MDGLCTYGMAARVVLRELLAEDTKRLTRLDCRFSSPVYPGETIDFALWRDGSNRALFRATVPERNIVIVNNGLAEFAAVSSSTATGEQT